MPFFKTNASTSIYITSIFGIAFVTSAQYIPNFNNWLSLKALPPIFYLWLLLFVFSYIVLVSIAKLIYKKIYHEFL